KHLTIIKHFHFIIPVCTRKCRLSLNVSGLQYEQCGHA
ncbi:unnamed protein product, partial [Rotaria sp. Silwood2]